MNIQVVTFWYNESFLSPFFLNHYRYVDRIHVILDLDTNDQTQEICKRYPNVVVQGFRFPEGFDDIIKMTEMESVYRTLHCDWVYIVDADEFLFPFPLGSDPRAFLEKEAESDLLYSVMWQVYRHETDADLDPGLPTVEQRRHGDTNVSRGVNKGYRKPNVIRAGLKPNWSTGCHACFPNEPMRVSTNYMRGTHWAMADACFAARRRLQFQKRLSRTNRDLGLGIRDETSDQLLAECQRHLEDPQLF